MGGNVDWSELIEVFRVWVKCGFFYVRMMEMGIEVIWSSRGLMEFLIIGFKLRLELVK